MWSLLLGYKTFRELMEKQSTLEYPRDAVTFGVIYKKEKKRNLWELQVCELVYSQQNEACMQQSRGH